MSIQSSNDLHDWSARVIERRTVLDFDLNCPPPDECIDPTGPRDEAAQYYNHYQGQATDAIDEDIAIISPRKFAEARKNFRRNHFESGYGAVIRRNGNTEVYGALSDVTTWPPFTIWSPLTISNNVSLQEQQTIHNLDLRLSCESSSRATKAKTDTDIPSTLALSSSIPPTDRTLRCAICIEPLVEETTTKCGHVFCRNCIETAIATQHRCPICRRKLRKRDIIRIYLPFTS
ncbi:E3 ubiquitin-protein ligase RNF4-like [Cucumis melo var. makuwa]|uniref:Uncharacterized protein LOC103483470 n=2 Tax=Cucumis melo TaxID=3656 RepID=A0A1S3AW86_CUCME|nr:uncharacterized protein LOC103483470 [Cucumis melo]KAA0049140.1 E3 ubiquitin-protein ligase RNF4-like [Cucumis melo var. makuwa]TYK17421.1 E3 ubiquitin-protein ligase RNF4-like [Cucumis melo var. makuwa]